MFLVIIIRMHFTTEHFLNPKILSEAFVWHNVQHGDFNNAFQRMHIRVKLIHAAGIEGRKYQERQRRWRACSQISQGSIPLKCQNKDALNWHSFPLEALKYFADHDYNFNF